MVIDRDGHSVARRQKGHRLLVTALNLYSIPIYANNVLSQQSILATILDTSARSSEFMERALVEASLRFTHTATGEELREVND